MRVYSPARAWPVSLAEIIKHVRGEHVADNDQLLRFISAATKYVEGQSNRQIVCASLTHVVNTFPGKGCPQALPRAPLVAVERIRYRDIEGTWQTVDADTYGVITHQQPGSFYQKSNRFWPRIDGDPDAVEIRYTAGMMAPLTAGEEDTELLVRGRTFDVGDRVQLATSGTLPTGLAINTPYFVVSASGDTDLCAIELSDTEDGAPIETEDAGEETHFVGTDVDDFETARQAIRLLVGHWYEHRESETDGFEVKTVPRALTDLLRHLSVGDQFIPY